MRASIALPLMLALATAVALGCQSESRPPPPPVDAGIPGRDFGPILVPCEDGNPSMAGLASDLMLEEFTRSDAEQMCNWQRLIFGSGAYCEATDTRVVVLMRCEDDFLDWGAVGCTVTACDIEDCTHARNNDPCDTMPPECAGLIDCALRAAGL